MGCRISWQNSDVHSHTFACEPHKPSHRRTYIMCSAWRGIDLGADSGANSPTGAIDEVAIDAGTMVGILFQNGETTARCSVPGFAGRDRTVGHDLLADHQIGALLGKGNNNVDVVGRRLSEQRLIYLQRFLAANVR